VYGERDVRSLVDGGLERRPFPLALGAVLLVAYGGEFEALRFRLVAIEKAG